MEGFAKKKKDDCLWRHFGGPRPRGLCPSPLNVGLWRPWTSPLLARVVTLGESPKVIGTCGKGFWPLTSP
jgi:hypothetical protein